VSFAPFIRNHRVSAFWEYNKQLFLRILTAGLYSTVLYSGLCIAIVSTDALFNLSIDEKIYLTLYPQKAKAEWYYVETLRESDTREHLGKKIEVTKGSFRLK